MGRPAMNFDRFARASAVAMGKSWAFAAACAIVVVWLPSFVFFGSIDTWQLLINTPTTVLTFLMLFLVQATVNRDSRALHAKLDEIIRAMSDADDGFQRIEETSEGEIEAKRPGTASTLVEHTDVQPE